MISHPKSPSRRDLLWFGLLLPAFVVILGAVARWVWRSPQAAAWIWGVGAAISVLFWLAPPLRRPLYLGWMYAALPIGWTISHLLLGIIFYAVITPIGLLMRLLGHDSLCRRFDRQAKSYWMARKENSDPKRYFRQF